MKVIKFGGTSVGTPERMRSIAQLIDDGAQKIVVLSALSGVTNSLVLIGEALANHDLDSASTLLASVEKRHQEFIDELFPDQAAERQAAREYLEESLAAVQALFELETIGQTQKNLVLAQGEIISTRFFSVLAGNEKAQWLPALDFMTKDANGEPEIERIGLALKPLLSSPSAYYITQGYICRNYRGEVDNLQRGGSDYTATILGAAIAAEEVQIWTDIDGMHNNDPRVVEKTVPIATLSFDEAAELAYFGAKILHPQTVLPAKKYHIPVRLKNTMDPAKEGTLISDTTTSASIKAVAAKDHITVVKIKSGRMLLAHGFMRRIFEIFEKYKTPVDMVTTSEVAVSITIDNTEYLKEIERELADLGAVEVEQHQTIVCIVGYMPQDEQQVLRRIFNALDDLPIRMVSYGGSRHNVSLLVQGKHKAEALRRLNKGVFGMD